MRPPGLILIAAFLRRHLPAVDHWAPEVLLVWLEWHWRNGGVGVIRERGRIVAVGVARCVHFRKQAETSPYYHAEDGPLLWVDQLASTHRLGLPLLLAQARLRFGPRKTVSGHVFKRPGELRMLPWKRVEKLLDHHGFL
jgi:hypothetical protein